MIQKPVGTINLLLPQKGLQGTDFVDFLLGDRNNEMPSKKKNIKRPEENFLVIKTDAVHNNKIMVIVSFNLRSLLLVADAIFHFEFVYMEQRLKNLEVLYGSIDPIKAGIRRPHCMCDVFHQREKNAVLYPTCLHFLPHPFNSAVFHFMHGRTSVRQADVNRQSPSRKLINVGISRHVYIMGINVWRHTDCIRVLLSCTIEKLNCNFSVGRLPYDKHPFFLVK